MISIHEDKPRSHPLGVRGPRFVMAIAVVLLIAMVVTTTILAQRRRHSVDKAPVALPKDLLPDEVFAAFRKSFEAMLVVADRQAQVSFFEHWCLEITNRRLLENLSQTEIEAKLGRPESRTWTPIERQYGDSLQRFLVRKADYWLYFFYEPVEKETLGIGLAFYEGRLWWSTYQRGRSTEKPMVEIYVDYVTPDSQSAP